MFYHAREDAAALRDGKMPYLTFGTGPKTLVMIPGLRLSGLQGTARAAAWYYRLFTEDYTVYMFDKKEPLAGERTIRGLAEDLAEAMDGLGLREAYVFGASQGGMIAQELAIRRPDLVAKLVLGVTLSRSNDTVRQVIGRWIDLAETQGLEAIARDYMTLGYSEKYLKKYGALLPLAIRAQKMMPKERFIALARACLTCDTYDRLDQIRCPVLVLGGAKDRIVTGEASREIAEKLGCPCYLYEDLSHEAYNEAKDFNRRVYDFFEGR